MHTRPMGLPAEPRKIRQTEDSPVQFIYRVLRYVKYATAGALGAMAIVQTAGQIFFFEPTETAILIASVMGAAVLVLLAKAVKLLW